MSTLRTSTILSFNLSAKFKELNSFIYTLLGKELPPSTSTTSPTQAELDRLLEDAADIGNPSIALALTAALTGIFHAQNKTEPANQLLPGYENYRAATQAAVTFLDKVIEEKTITSVNAVLESLPKDPKDLMSAFNQSVSDALGLNREALASLPAEKIANKGPRIAVLGPASRHLAYLHAIPQNDTTIRSIGVLDRELKVLVINPPKSIRLSEMLQNIKDLKVDDYKVALPTMPDSHSVDFLIELERTEHHQRVIIITGDNKLSTFNLMPKFDPRIKDLRCLTSIFCGVPHELDSGKEATFTATRGDSLTAEREKLLLNQLTLSDSSSVVVLILPLKPLPRLDFDSCFKGWNALSSSATRSMGFSPLHTSAGHTTTGATYLKSEEKFIVDPDRPIRAFRIQTLGI